MDFGLSAEQLLLRDSARAFVERVCPPTVAKRWDDESHFPPELFDALADLDWLSLAFDPEDGGSEGGAVEMTIIAEELGRASFDVAMCYIANLIAALTVSRHASPEQRAELVPDLVAGTRRFAVSISEPDAGSDVASIRTHAEDRGDHFVVNGEKMWCTGAGLPNTLLAMYVRTDREAPPREGISLLIVDPTAPGVTVQRIPTLARHILGTNSVSLSDVVVPRDRLVGELNGGWRVLLSGLELERVLLAGGYVGAAEATVQEATDYAKDRTQFGRRIGDFQALAHLLADLRTEVEAARLLAYRAAWMLDRGLPCGAEGSMAKLFGSELYVRAARQGMQVFGGYGFSTESVMSFRYRESIVATISGGTSQIQRNAIARNMGLRP
jgi:alkylation response protein AidB-like acyl-CoA dehydrogenase